MLLLALLLFGSDARARSASSTSSLSLVAGWNNLVYPGETLPLAQALSGGGNVVDAVWQWDADSQAWESWFAVAPSLATLTVLTADRAYWVHAIIATTWSPPVAVLFQTMALEILLLDGNPISLSVEIADTPLRRGRGLMFRPALAADAGMIFLFPVSTQTGFWMQNTLVPLSIAFIDDAGMILEIQDMEPLTTTLYCPEASYRWALEVTQGWFTTRGVGVGAVVHFSGQ